MLTWSEFGTVMTWVLLAWVAIAAFMFAVDVFSWMPRENEDCTCNGMHKAIKYSSCKCSCCVKHFDKLWSRSRRGKMDDKK